MHKVKTILVTVLCATIILAAGYGGIVVSGNMMLENSGEPQPVNLSGNISKLFYSKLEDDIQLFPWNLYPAGGAVTKQLEDDSSVFDIYDPSIEYNVFYTLIAIATNSDQQEVCQWYDQHNKTIMMSMVRGISGDTLMDIFFYDDIINLGGKKYNVKIACTGYSIISFSCLQGREEQTKDTEEWETKKDAFLAWMEEQPDKVETMFSVMSGIYEYGVSGTDDWYAYVNLFQAESQCIEKTGNETTEGGEAVLDMEILLKEQTRNQSVAEGIEGEVDEEETALQVVELKDSILLLKEGNVAMGLYYDVMNERVAGFHYFYQY